MALEEVQKHSVHTLVFRSLKRTHDMFISDVGNPVPLDDKAEQIKRACKFRAEYGFLQNLNDGEVPKYQSQKAIEGGKSGNLALTWDGDEESNPNMETGAGGGGGAMVPKPNDPNPNMRSLMQKKTTYMPKPVWHAPWKLMRVISGHLGWVRSVTVEPGNEWFATGSGDRTIKIWDLASGTLKLSLTGHVSTVRGLAVSPRHPYLFSAGEDKLVKCWDLETNKVIRHYHGHLSAVYSLALHPTIDLLVTAGRDSSARVWDMRTKAQVHALSGHTNTIASVLTQASEPQVITGSHDSTIRLWDLVAGKTRSCLTNHKKSVRAMVIHPGVNMMASASADNIKQWKFPEGNFVQNLTGHNAILNSIAINGDGVLVSGADNGTMNFWDWRTGYNFQRHQTVIQPGSIDSEAGIFAMTFDHSGTRLLSVEADKTIKIYKEDDSATEDSNPILWKPDILRRKKY